MATLVGASACGTADEEAEALADPDGNVDYSGAALGTLGVLCSFI
ncbi:hypothetical protein WMF39_32940 [Sorangium sp. So ce1504]